MVVFREWENGELGNGGIGEWDPHRSANLPFPDFRIPPIAWGNAGMGEWGTAESGNDGMGEWEYGQVGDWDCDHSQNSQFPNSPSTPLISNISFCES